MKSPASSFRAERAVARWYREPWPWLLMAGPLVVVAASLASAWIAVKSDDGVVADDYYKQGLAINRKLPRANVDPARANWRYDHGDHARRGAACSWKGLSTRRASFASPLRGRVRRQATRSCF